MEIEEYQNIYRNEQTHFYYQANHNLILSLLHRYLTHKPPTSKLRILDAGCGTGLLAKKMSSFAEVWGIDISSSAVLFSKKRGLKIKRASVTDIPFKANFFDVVISLDVLYHQQVESDTKALSEMFRILKPKGILIIRVPANKWLISRHDRFVHTSRRYSSQDLTSKLETAGFKIIKLSYINLILLFPALVNYLYEKTFPQKSTESIIRKIPTTLNNIVVFLLNTENSFLKHIDFPFGLGLFAIGEKP